jgi:hypothetical protein
MDSPQLHTITQLARVFTQVAVRSNFTNVIELNQFRSNITCNQLNNPTQVEPSQSNLQTYLPFQDIECITNVNWPSKNLNQELALTAQSQSNDYTQFDVV